jgi:hypothetical protein
MEGQPTTEISKTFWAKTMDRVQRKFSYDTGHLVETLELHVIKMAEVFFHAKMA